MNILKVWFRNYQILEETGSLAEIGPRMVLNPIKIFEGSFSGQTIWENDRSCQIKNGTCESDCILDTKLKKMSALQTSLFPYNKKQFRRNYMIYLQICLY